MGCVAQLPRTFGQSPFSSIGVLDLSSDRTIYSLLNSHRHTPPPSGHFLLAKLCHSPSLPCGSPVSLSTPEDN